MPNSSASPASSKPSAPRATPRPLQVAMLLAGAFFLSRVTGFVQLAVINAQLPVEARDAYFAAFTLPDVVNHLVAGGAMSITFIPLFTQIRDAQSPQAAWRFFSTIATLMGTALALLIAISVIFTVPLTALLTPGLAEPGKEKTFALAVAMTRIMLPAQMCFYLGGMLVGVLNANKRFGATGFTGVVYNLVAVFVGVGLWMWKGAEVGFAWGILIGALCGSFLLPLVGALGAPREERVKYSPSLDWRLPGVKRFFVNALPIALGVSLPVMDQIIVKYFASSLDKGALSALVTGNRFMLAPLGIVAQAASVAAFPYLASDSAAENWTSFAEFLRNGLRRLMFLTLPLSVGLILIAQPLLSLFRAGKFESMDAQLSAVAFAFYCVGLFAWAGQQLAARGFYALQDTRTPTIIGTILAILFCAVCWLVVRLEWGVAGLAFATSLGAGAQFLGVTLALDRRLRSRKYNAPLRLEKVVGTLLRTGVACAAMGFAGLVADSLTWRLFEGNGKGGDVARIAIVSLVAWSAFVVAAQRCRIPEYFWLRDKMLRRAKR